MSVVWTNLFVKEKNYLFFNDSEVQQKDVVLLIFLCIDWSTTFDDVKGYFSKESLRWTKEEKIVFYNRVNSYNYSHSA